MRRTLPRASTAFGICAALVLASTGAVAQAVPVPLGSPLPAVVPLPPLPPLAKEGTLARPASSKPITTASAARGAATAIPDAPVPMQPNKRDFFDAAQQTTVERVNAYFNSISTLVGNFVQVGPDGRKSEGDFYLQKPGKVRFDYDPPNPIELVADGNSVAVRDRRLATQDLYPLSQTPLRFLLSERMDLFKDSHIVGVYQDEIFITVVIEEAHPLVGSHRLMIMFGAKDTQLKQWTITDPQGYDTTVAVYNLDSKKKPDASLFRIEKLR